MAKRLHLLGFDYGASNGRAILGTLEDGKVTLSKIDPSPECEHRDTVFDVNVENDSHGGGDIELVKDFVEYVTNGKASVSCTSIQASLAGHLAVFLADKSMKKGGEPQKVIL